MFLFILLLVLVLLTKLEYRQRRLNSEIKKQQKATKNNMRTVNSLYKELQAIRKAYDTRREE